jgi:ATP/ADP translocase
MTKVDPDIVLVLGNPHTLFVALGLELFVKKTKYRIIDRTKEMVNVETANFFTDYLPY